MRAASPSPQNASLPGIASASSSSCHPRAVCPDAVHVVRRMTKMLLEVERLSAVGACASPGNVSGDPHVCGQRCGIVIGGENGSVIDAGP